MLLSGQLLVGPVPAGEPPGCEGRGAFERRVGPGLDGRDQSTLIGDEGELGDTPGVVARNDLFVGPGHHVIGNLVRHLGGVHEQEPRLALVGPGGKPSGSARPWDRFERPRPAH
jgi:hypothetical protein